MKQIDGKEKSRFARSIFPLQPHGELSTPIQVVIDHIKHQLYEEELDKTPQKRVTFRFNLPELLSLVDCSPMVAFEFFGTTNNLSSIDVEGKDTHIPKASNSKSIMDNINRLS